MIAHKIEAGLLFMGITDHHAIYCGMQKEKKKLTVEKKNTKKKTLIFINQKEVNRNIKESDWEEVINEENPNRAMEKLQSKLREIIQRNTKEKEATNKYGAGQEKWVTNQILKNIRKRDRLVSKWNREIEPHRKIDMNKKIKEKTKEIKKEIEISKTNFWRNKLKESKNNIKKTLGCFKWID